MDWSAFSLPVANSIRELQSLSFVKEGRNVILVGNPGVGKTHTALSLGLLACQANLNVLYVTIPNLILELKEAYKEHMVVSYKKKFMSYDLIILDELGYISFDKDANNNTDYFGAVIKYNDIAEYTTEKKLRVVFLRDGKKRSAVIRKEEYADAVFPFSA